MHSNFDRRMRIFSLVAAGAGYLGIVLSARAAIYELRLPYHDSQYQELRSDQLGQIGIIATLLAMICLGIALALAFALKQRTANRFKAERYGMMVLVIVAVLESLFLLTPRFHSSTAKV